MGRLTRRREDLKLPNDVSESVKRLNPGLYLGSVAAHKPKQNQGRTLVEVFQEEERRRSGLGKSGPVLAIALVFSTRRRLDLDNAIAGAKPLRDAIARWFGLDDNDDTIEWTYGQVRITGQEGTIVRVERL